MSNISEIKKFKETVEFLKNKGRTNTSLQNEAGINFKLFKDITQKQPAEVTVRASSLGKIQDFTKKYFSDILYSKAFGGKQEGDIIQEIFEEPKELTSKEVVPLAPRHTEGETEKELKAIVEKSRKELLKEYIEKIVVLCEDLPPFIEIQILIKP